MEKPSRQFLGSMRKSEGPASLRSKAVGNPVALRLGEQDAATTELVRKRKSRGCRVLNTSIMTLALALHSEPLQNTAVILVLQSLRHDGHVFETSLGYAERACLKQKTK